ncbi:MAG: hypothetical protein PHQ42_04340 [Patescibacteria group bacterium]|nr:hypothetical protein [Patescibacteria group bacterium]
MDIDFLPEEEKKKKIFGAKKKGEAPGAEVKWSSPEKKGPSPKLPGEKRGIKSYLPDFFNAGFFRKKKAGKEAVHPDNLADRNKLKQSRKELLKLIGEEKKSASHPPAAGKAEETGEEKISPTKKREIREIKAVSALTNLFKPAVSAFKKFGKNLKISKGPEEKPSREQPPAKEKEISPRQGEAGKETVSQPVKAEEKKENNGGETLETNLIKDEVTIFFDWQKNISLLLIYMVLAALAVGAAYGWLSWRGSQKSKESRYFVEQFSELDKEIAKIEEEAKKVLVFKKKLNLASSLLDQHVYWTNFFGFLEENTLTDVYYSDFSGDNKGKYNLSASAKSFSAIQAQVKRLLASEYVSVVSVNQAGISTGGNKAGDIDGVAFDLKLVIDPSIFTSVQ